MKHYFIYETTNTLNGKKYRGVHCTNNLDDGYLGSGVLLKQAIAKHGKENFTREIIHLCKNKGTTNYLEAKEQFTRSVLENKDLWYNTWISVKVNRSHVKL